MQVTRAKSAVQKFSGKFKITMKSAVQRRAIKNDGRESVLAEPPLPPVSNHLQTLIIGTCILCVFWACSISFVVSVTQPESIAIDDLIKLAGLCLLSLKLTSRMLKLRLKPKNGATQ